jgi:plastocyanin
MRRHLPALLSVAGIAFAAAVLPPAAADTSPAASATKRVRIGDNFFSRTSLTIQRGDRVRWVWVGRAPHNVTVTTGPREFRSTTKRDGAYSKRLRARGTYRYICTVHPSDMRAKVVVR